MPGEARYCFMKLLFPFHTFMLSHSKNEVKNPSLMNLPEVAFLLLLFHLDSCIHGSQSSIWIRPGLEVPLLPALQSQAQLRAPGGEHSAYRLSHEQGAYCVL